jgi:hypothetical protein
MPRSAARLARAAASALAPTLALPWPYRPAPAQPATPHPAPPLGAPLPAYAAARDSAQRFAGRPNAPSSVSPPGGDTAGYWQQRADYQIVARLDERRETLTATGRLTYVNASPDTLHELFVHQHLNAFRPGSRWAADDAREGRVRFQTLGEPAYGYERFTSDPRVGGVPVRAEYPGAPDSTVARLVLPRPLAPGDSAVVEFAWEARPSTILRRQGRRGRSYDFAQWYPKVAVYDRGGWQPHALVPSGELYGEFGTFDVTLVLADDQVVGATGVPVEGDPGWARVSRSGPVATGAAAYGPVAPGPPALLGGPLTLRPGERAVRFLARGVHHFGWSVSPDYRYEGGAYVRRAPARAPGGRFPVWDTVRVHVLYRPGDDATFGGGRAVARTVAALAWLEQVYGPYGYPQMTTLHRLERGGTEFPMLQMDGGASQGLILHEGGHVYSYGLLANNEWQSGWMDEGLTSYQSAWALGTERAPLALYAGRPGAPLAGVGGPPTAARLAADRRALDAEQAARDTLVHQGRAQPIGLRGDLFADFAAYNAAVYGRGEAMYEALRDVLGEPGFVAFLRDYYGRWAFRHVDEAAMRASAERAAPADRPWARDLGWCFAQWVHDVGTVDYALRGVAWGRSEGGGFVTRGRLVRTGTYRHPMPVGVRTAAGWTVVRGDPLRDSAGVEIATAGEPLEVRLDPFGQTQALAARFYVVPRRRRDLAAPTTGRVGDAAGAMEARPTGP